MDVLRFEGEVDLTTPEGLTNIAKYALKRAIQEKGFTLDEALADKLKNQIGNSGFWFKKAAMELLAE